MPNTKEVEQAAEKYAENKSSSEVFKQAHIADFIAGYNYALSNPLEQSENKEEWVSCSERLPVDGKCVLFVGKLGFAHLGYFIEKTGKFHSMNSNTNIESNYWQPLPNPPKNIV